MIAGGGILAVLVGVFGVYPACLQRRAEARATADGCSGNRPPTNGFYSAMREDERAAAFPGFGASDVVAAEAVFCVGTFAQARLAPDSTDEITRRATCQQWRTFARWYRGLRPDAPDLCPMCANTP